MVVTAKESRVLRQAGYNPEAQNLDQALTNMFHQAAPGFADGYDGGYWGGYEQFNQVDPNSFFARDASGRWVQMDPNGIAATEAAALNAYFAANPGPGPNGLNPGAIGPNYGYNSGGNITVSPTAPTAPVVRGPAFGYSPSLLRGSVDSQLTNGFTNGIIGAVGNLTPGLASTIGPGVSIMPPSASRASYGANIGSMNVTVSITGGTPRQQLAVNQAVRAFSRSLDANKLQLT
jgi:hypothetical protein